MKEEKDFAEKLYRVNYATTLNDLNKLHSDLEEAFKTRPLMYEKPTVEWSSKLAESIGTMQGLINYFRNDIKASIKKENE